MEDRIQLKGFQALDLSDPEMNLSCTTITTKTSGVALVISNDLVNHPECKMSSIHENSRKLCEFLLQFNYFVHHRQNIAKREFIKLCKRLAGYTYPSNCKRLVVAFSGCGFDGALHLLEGRLFLEDVVCYFESTSPTFGGMIRLFFIDTHNESSVATLGQDGSGIRCLSRIEIDANLLVAYSSLNYYDQNSEHFNLHGRWISCLADELERSRFASLQNVLTRVNEAMAGIAAAAKCSQFADYRSSPEELFILPSSDTTMAVLPPVTQ